MARIRENGVRSSLFWLTVFAIAMAHVEAALVVHLRSLYYPDNPLALFPLNLLSERDQWIELAREAATLVMLLSVAAMTERGAMRVFAAFVYLFGVWDLGYYAWLKLMIDWPTAWLEWDVLFLIPWPWFGPWPTAAMIAVLFVVWGAWVLLTGRHERSFAMVPSLCLAFGIAVALTSFLLPAWPLLAGGRDAFRDFIPDRFPWVLYALGYAAMATGLISMARRRYIP